MYTLSPVFKMPGVHTDEHELSDERIAHDLESQRRERFLSSSAWRSTSFPIVRIDALDRRNIERRRQEIHHCVEQRLHAFVLESRSADHREHLQRNRRSCAAKPSALPAR